MSTQQPQSVFADYQDKNWPYRYQVCLHAESIAGGVPLDPDVLSGHLKRKTDAADNLIRREVAEAVVERGLTQDEAIEELANLKGHIGFRRDAEGLYIGGYQVKAMLREAANIAVAAGRLKKGGWGLHSANRGILSWLAEHLFIVEDRVHLGVTEPTGTNQSFIAKVTPKGPIAAIQNTDYVEGCDLHFTVETDWEFDDADWAAIWTTAEREGLGAARKMGYGRLTVTQWERITAKPKRRTRAA
jgi:hypothetical protein